MMICQTFSNREKYDYGNILKELGYDLKDRGQYWSCNAVFRGGDNPHALQIWKNSGRVKDYVTGEYYLFDSFIRKACGREVAQDILKRNKVDCFDPIFYKKVYIMEEKTYDPKVLDRLLPHYDFYLDRGISEKTLKKYQCGLATGGEMYQRLVFPVYRRDKRIHGFSGRDMSASDNRPKWKHLGRATQWFYPYFLYNEVADKMLETQTVYICESIGDSLALSNAGYDNNLVAFGVNLSPNFVSKLASLDLTKIIVAFNNDEGKGNGNAGKVGALKSLLKLSKCFDVDCLNYMELPRNDWGEMSKDEIVSYISKWGGNKIDELIEFGRSVGGNLTFRRDLDSFKKRKHEN